MKVDMDALPAAQCAGPSDLGKRTAIVPRPDGRGYFLPALRA